MSRAKKDIHSPLSDFHTAWVEYQEQKKKDLELSFLDWERQFK